MEQKRKKRGWLPWVVILAVAGAGIFYWNYTRSLEDQEHRYTAYTLRQRDPLVLKGASQVEEAVAVSMDPSKGSVQDIRIATGERVEEGDVLFTYESRQLDEMVEDAERQLERAGEALENASADLADAEEDQATDEASLDSSRSALESSRERLREAQKDLADAQAEQDADLIEELTDLIQETTDEIQEATQDVGRYQARVDSWPAQIDQLRRLEDQAETAREDARIMAERARDNAGPRETADIKGLVRVNDRNRRNPQAPLVEIVSEETVIKATVTEYDHFRLKNGENVKIRVVSTSEEMDGVISTVEPLPQTNTAVPGQAVTVSSVNYDFEVEPERPIQPGYSVEIHVELGEIVVPSSAVVREGEDTFLWILQEGTSLKKPVTLQRSGTYWILTGGLSEGDVILQDPDEGLSEGLEVRTVQP